MVGIVWVLLFLLYGFFEWGCSCRVCLLCSRYAEQGSRLIVFYVVFDSGISVLRRDFICCLKG